MGNNHALVEGVFWMFMFIWGTIGDGRGFAAKVSGMGTETADGTGEFFLLRSWFQGFPWSLLSLSLKSFKAICL